MFDENTIYLRCLLNKTFTFPGIGILHNLTIDEIIDIGVDIYNQYIGCLCITQEDIDDNIDLPEGVNITPYELIVGNCINDEKFKNTITQGLSKFFKESVEFYNHLFIIGDLDKEQILHQGNFNFVVETLRYINCINPSKKQIEPKPKTEAERKFLKDLKKRRAKYRQQYQEDDNLFDIISAVCSKHPSINLFNVGNLTMFQLIDQYKRLNMIDEYFLSLESLLHGASRDDVKVVHWSSKKIS